MKLIKLDIQYLHKFTLLLASILVVTAFSLSTQAQEAATDGNMNQATATPTPKPVPTPIAPSNIVSQAEAAEKKLQEIQTGISESPGVQVIGEELPKLKDEIDSRTTETTQILSARPSLETLRTTEQDWQALTKNITAWKKDLKAQIGVLDGQIEELKDQNEVWQKTLDALGKSQDTNSNSQNTSGNNSEILSNQIFDE